MPLYEYQCDACGQVTEVRQGITDPKLKTCAQVVKRAESPTKACGSAKGKVSRLISGTSFLLKGSGWYRDGYASQPKSTGSGGGEAKPSESGGKGDAAPAAPAPKTESTSESRAQSKTDSKAA